MVEWPKWRSLAGAQSNASSLVDLLPESEVLVMGTENGTRKWFRLQ